jgi:transposase
MPKGIGLVFVGIDVSANTLMVAIECDQQSGRKRREFPNTAAGHKSLIRWLRQRDTVVRACIEATGLYSLDLALALHRAEGVEVMGQPTRHGRLCQSLVATVQDR